MFSTLLITSLIGTGFSEAMLEERSKSLSLKVIPKPKSYYRYSDTINPDVWFEASEVWEVKAADLTISPVYCAALGAVDPNKGISLRFPRLLCVREDKGPEEASSSEMVRNRNHLFFFPYFVFTYRACLILWS
ncbi:putative DNA ligase (ATP) [Helianthus annuus]|nr:putative DNA ligase (ATP) [Helianthus annuus]